MRRRLSVAVLGLTLACGPAETARTTEESPIAATQTELAPPADSAAPSTLRIVGVEAFSVNASGRRYSGNLIDNADANHFNTAAEGLEVVVHLEVPAATPQSVEVALWAREGENEVFAETRSVTPLPQSWDGRVSFTLHGVGCRFLLLKVSAMQVGGRAEAYRALPFVCGE